MGDDERALRSLSFERGAFTAKEQALLEFALRAEGDPHGIADEEFAALRAMGVTDRELVEVLETMTLAAGLNRYCDTLEIEPDAWLDGGGAAGDREATP